MGPNRKRWATPALYILEQSFYYIKSKLEDHVMITAVLGNTAPQSPLQASRIQNESMNHADCVTCHATFQGVIPRDLVLIVAIAW
ncbi:hypothetical protein BgiMline_022821, partial [Biomphalaria glabrata]